MENPIKSIEYDKAKLLDLLNQYAIPLDDWGTGEAKTFDHLFEEIQTGESVLIEDKNSGELVRELSFLAIVVLYRHNEDVFQLTEEKQVFTDGRHRVRQSDISVGEKIKQGENNMEEAVKRALLEELGIGEGFNIGKIEQTKEEVDSKSYPGLKSRRTRFDVSVEIDSTQYNSDGYKEVQLDKTTYFIWKKI